MNIELWKQRKKELKLTYDDLATMTGLSRSGILEIFRGGTTSPRIDTVQAIERALGLSSDTDSETGLAAAEASFADYVLSADEKLLIDYYRLLVPSNKLTVFNLLKSVFKETADLPLATAQRYLGVVN